MAFPGWLTFAGVEVINLDRVTSYARTIVPQLDVRIPAPDHCEDLHGILGQNPYTTPAGDNAPWYDPAVPDSHGFAGLYPLSVTGLDNDTREAVVVEGTFDGGFVGQARRRTREVRVSGLLIGEDQGCVDYGLFWLRSILDADVRSVQRGRPDPGTETMASVPDICGQERGDLQFLAACPELGCGKHCGHNASGADKSHSVTLSSLKPTSGTYGQVDGLWTFTPADASSGLRTPLLPDDQTCPVRYVWDVSGLPNAPVTGFGVRDNRLAYTSPTQDRYARVNLATNPQWKTSTGLVEVRRNLAVNPAMRKLSAPSLLATNRVGNPVVAANTNGWVTNAGTGGTAALSRQGLGAPDNVASAYARLQWSVAQNGTTVMPYLGFGGLTGGFDEMTVVAGERVYGSMWWRTSVSGTTWRAVLRFYNSSDALIAGDILGPTMTARTSGYTWQEASCSGVAPAGAVAVRLLVEKVGGTNMPINATLEGTAAMVVRNQRAMQFFSGATPSRGGLTFAWVGTANASASTATGFENTLRTNTVPNPALALNLDGWAALGGSGSTWGHTRELSPGLSLDGNTIPAFTRLKWSAVTTGTTVNTGFSQGADTTLPVLAQPSQRMTFSAYVRSSVFDRTAHIGVDFFTGTTQIGSTVWGSDFAVGGTAWKRGFVTTTVPVGAERAVVYVYAVGGRNWAANDTFDVTAMMGELATELGTYFDGSTPSTVDVDYAWGYPSGRSISVARRRVTGTEVVGRTNWALNPLQDDRLAPGIVSNSALDYPLTQSAGRSLTTRGGSLNPTASSVYITGVSSSATSQPCAPGDTWTFSVNVAPSSASPRNISASLQWRDSGGAVLFATTAVVTGSAGANIPVRVWASGTAPAATAAVTMAVVVTTLSGNAVAGEVVGYDNLLVEKTSGLRPFFSGSAVSPSLSGLDPVWEGAPGQSRSFSVGGKIDSTLAAAGAAPLWASKAITPSGGLSASAFIVPDTGSMVLIAGQPDTVVVPGNFYSASLVVRQVGATVEATNTLSITASFYTAGGTSLGEAVTGITVPVTGNWQTISLPSSFVAPATAASVKFLLVRAGAWSDVNARLEVGDILWERVGAVGVPAGAYFDGTTSDTSDLDYAWSGAADASASLAQGVAATAGGTSTFPAPYRTQGWASSGFSLLLPPAAWVEPVHAAGTNGMTPDADAVLSFDVHKISGTMTATLFFDLGGAPDSLTTTLTAPLDGRVDVVQMLPEGSVTAYWQISNDTGSDAYVSRVVIESGVPAGGEFFDGSIPPATWDATADASTSTLPAVLVTVYLPGGAYNDGLPSFSSLRSEAALVINSVTAYYYEPDTVANQTQRYWRTLRKATCISGPEITREFNSTSAVLKQVEFTITCPDPWAYGNPRVAASVTSGAATYTMPGVTVSTYTPGTTDLTCYAEDVAYVPTDPNCGTIPRPPRPAPVDPGCATGSVNQGLLFFIPPSLLEERAGTYPTLVFKPQSFIRELTVVRCWPLPFSGATLEDISACDTRGWLWLGGIAANRGFVLDCAARRGTLTNVPVTGGSLNLEATHFVYPPKSVPFNPANAYDLIPLTWPEMYGGNYGYFILVEQIASAAATMDLQLVARR